MSNGKFRKKTNFAQVSNVALRDKSLSLKVKGLYALIQSYITIDNEDFVLSKDKLVKMCKEGERAFESGWKELKDSGYLKIYRIPDKNNKGKFVYEYDLLDVPNKEIPALISCGSDGEPIKKEEENDQPPQNVGSGDDQSPQNVGGGECSGCIPQDMLNVGSNNNTQSNNIKSNNTLSSNIEKKSKEKDNAKHYSSSTSVNNTVPEDIYMSDATLKLLKMDKAFTDVDFSDMELYMLLIESIAIACERDGVDKVTPAQYRFFRNTLVNKISQMTINDNGDMSDVYRELELYT